MGVIDRIVPINKGNWVAETTYGKLNIVRHNSKVWQSKVDNNADEPSDLSDKWMFLVGDGRSANYDVVVSTTDIGKDAELSTNSIYIVYEE